ncbi:hypothetical protein [Spirosoma foliorum]|uniref:Uncharacterized protein n=1 Tax=Spirosoma foliorum TaxID=2710596 RepID=A0A7G5H2H4_9BACT|nr:hypothetical protein [Spirosoma foliorum]QMW05316.1 hypothetical protein H3H32_10725 [Spirosoma foliorum]
MEIYAIGFCVLIVVLTALDFYLRIKLYKLSKARIDNWIEITELNSEAIKANAEDIKRLKKWPKASPIISTHQDKAWCTLFIENGTAILRMPDGTIIPTQTGLTYTSNVDQLPTATVTLFVNLAESAVEYEEGLAEC